MIHMEYYLVVSTLMMFAGIYGFFTRRNTLAILIIRRVDAECHRYQLRCIQPFSVSRTAWKAISLPCFPLLFRQQKRPLPLPS